MKGYQNAFVVLYSGRTVGESRIIGACSDAALVRSAAKRMIDTLEKRRCDAEADETIRQSRLAALRAVRGDTVKQKEDITNES